MQSKQLLFVVGCAILVGGGAFYGGMTYAKTQIKPVLRPGMGTFAGIPGGARGGIAGGAGRLNGAGFLNGEILTKDAASLTVKLRDGGSKIVYYSSSTTVGKVATGSIDEATTGTEIMVNGTTNPDGSLAATTIQLR